MLPTGPVLIAATAAAGFWRCGKHFTKSGIVAKVEDFTKEQWARLAEEPMLKLAAATDIAAATDEADTAARSERLQEAISSLSADDFQNDGKPKLTALNELLSDEPGKVTGAERDAAFAALKDAGFTAPE